MNLRANMEAEGMQIIDGELFIGIKEQKIKHLRLEHLNSIRVASYS